ncbi:hypothetical protein RB601_000952 [Gaeumannomyces tritici]
MAARSTALKIDWAQVTTSLGLRGQTVAALHAFKKRNDDVRRKVQQLSEQPTTVDFASYRAVLKNRAVVDEIEKRFAAFKPAAYDVSRQLKAIDAFEVEAVKNAEATKTQVDLELKDLQATLKNIEEARPFDELTVVRASRQSPPSDIARWEGGEQRELRFANVPRRKHRKRSPPPSPPSTKRPPSWSPRAAGPFPDTRQAASLPPPSSSVYCPDADPRRRRNSATCRCYKQPDLALLPLVYASIVDRRIESGQPVVEGATIHVLIWRLCIGEKMAAL